MSDTKKLKVEGAVVTPTSPTEDKVPSYKVIPETNTEYKTVPNSNMVKENGDNCKDGADEKMLTPKGELADVKFITGDQQNGDAKIDILEIKQAFTGLTKEELLKFSNDPFWVRLRWVMFIGFWLLWVGMLAGAIVIIVGAPKCAPPPPKTWWQEGPLVEIGESPDESSWNLPTLSNMLSNFTELKVKGVIIPEYMLPGNGTYSHMEADEEFENLVKNAKEKNIKLVVELTANSVPSDSAWFKKSELGELPYKDYFVWRAGSGTWAGGEPKPPNNWVSMGNNSAWTFSSVRKEFYLHQLGGDRADLNFRNPEVVKEFTKVIQYWLGQGASGMRLSHAKHLLVDPSFKDEDLSHRIGSHLNDYDFNSHTKTTFQEGLAELLMNWKHIIMKETNDEGVLMWSGYIEKAEPLMKNGTMVVDLPLYSRIMDEPTHITTEPKNAKQFQEALRNTFLNLGEGAWPSWQYKSGGDALSSEYHIMSSLLPGVAISNISQLLEPRPGYLEEFKALLVMRDHPSFKYGEFATTLLANDTVTSFTRLKSGNPGMMVLFNPSDTTVYANTTVIQNVPEKVTVFLLSKNYNEDGVAVKTKLNSDNIPVSAKSVIVMTYVPLKE